MPRLLARLQAQQGRPEGAAFRQLHAGVAQLLALRRLVATLAPNAAAAADAERAAAAVAAAESGGGGGGVAAAVMPALGAGGGGGGGWLAEAAAASGFADDGWEPRGADASGWGGASGFGGGGGRRAGNGAGRQPPAVAATAWDGLEVSRRVLTGVSDELLACERARDGLVLRAGAGKALACKEERTLQTTTQTPAQHLITKSNHTQSQPTGQGLLCDVVDLEQGPAAAADATAGLVRPGVCAALDALRADYDALPELMTRVGAMGVGG